VHCPAHRDRSPSLDVAERGRILVVCRAGCSQLDVIGPLQRRGLWPTRQAPPSRSEEPPLATARRHVLQEARSQRWGRAGVLAAYGFADELRYARRAVDELRRAALDPADARTWERLAVAAEVELLTALVEIELDEGRMA
jgi:hypothetical protein